MNRILILGLRRGATIARALAQSERVSIAGLIDTDPERLAACGRECRVPAAQQFSSLEAALAAARAHVLVVATPTPLHVPHVLAGLAAGLHVLCEKPLAVQRDDALRMRDAAARAGRSLAVLQNLRYGPQFRKCRELLNAGLLGRIATVSFQFRRWRNTDSIKHPHAILFNHGVHHLDAIRYVTGATLASVSACEWDPSWLEQGRGRCVRATLRTAQNIAITYDASYAETGTQTPQSGETRITGELGSLTLSGEFEAPLVRHSSNAKRGAEEFDRQIPVEPVEWQWIDRKIIEDFCDAVQLGQKAETDVEDNLITLDWLWRIAAAIEQEEQHGRPA